MAFPDSVKTFVEAVDPTTIADIQHIQQYQALLSEGNFNAAATLLASMENGIKMNMSAGRFNDVLNEIIAIEKFYIGLNGVREYIQKNINAYSNINLWDNSKNFDVGNITSNGEQWFSCIKANGPTTIIIEPGVSVGWENYWKPFLVQQRAKQYPIQAEEPSDLKENELWFQIVGEVSEVPDENGTSGDKKDEDSGDEFWP